jgi:hypothetical protein
MATARDKLVADWRQRLHAAEALLVESPRYAWLGQMRVRLYRFLLACYGKQPWQTTPRIVSTESVVFDVPDAALLHGKPARSVAKIQSVLKSVAGSHDTAVETGPWMKGLDADSWVIVATRESNIDPDRLQRLFDWLGIASHRRVYGADEAVEVALVDHACARAIVKKYDWWLRGTYDRGRLLAMRSSSILWYLLILGPHVAFVLIGAIGLAVTWLASDEINTAAFWPIYLRVWGASAVAGAIAFLPLAWTLFVAHCGSKTRG